MGAFHAYDIRGIYNVDFDRHTAYKVGYFIPELLKTDKVLVGRDCRLSSPEIHEYLVKGITDAGADVYDIGLSTTPMVYFGTANYGFKASVQITASHNPKEYNGMKVSCENALPGLWLGADSEMDRGWKAYASRRCPGKSHSEGHSSRLPEFLAEIQGRLFKFEIGVRLVEWNVNALCQRNLW